MNCEDIEELKQMLLERTLPSECNCAFAQQFIGCGSECTKKKKWVSTYTDCRKCEDFTLNRHGMFCRYLLDLINSQQLQNEI